MEDVRADRWLAELADLRAAHGVHPVEVWWMRAFAQRQPLPADIADLVRALARPRELAGLTIALYRTAESDAAAELLVPVSAEDAPHLPWFGQVEVRGTAAAGHAVSLCYQGTTVDCSGPVTVPQVWIRRYRNRPRRWPRSGAWDAAVGSEIDG